VWLRFKASDDFMNQLVNSGYMRVNWSRVRSGLRLPESTGYRRAFHPAWNPEGVEVKECYEGWVRCAWSSKHTGHHLLVIDRFKGWSTSLEQGRATLLAH
jgi:hypothetical protein